MSAGHASAAPGAEPAVVWQGFRHAWTYNHRLNRLGSGISHLARTPGRVEAEAWHAAASGTGADVATFTGYHTAVRAAGVAFTEVRLAVDISSREEEPQAFVREVRVPARPGLAAPVLAACLNGLDLRSATDADKLVSLHLALTPPVLDAETGEVVLHLLGALNVDCDSPECDTGDGVPGLFMGAAIGGHLGGPVGAVVGAAAGAALTALLGKLDVRTRYRLEVSLLIAQAEPGAMAVTGSTHANAFDWDTETAIRRIDVGTVPAALATDAGRPWAAAVPTIRQLSLEVTRERGVLRPDTAMHLLEWDMAVRLADESPPAAELDLFFRNWRERESDHLDQQIDVPILGWIDPLDDLAEGFASHRDAGSARATMTVGLLQFAAAETATGSVGGRIAWAGGGRSADAPEALARSTLAFQLPDPAPPPPRRADAGALLLTLDHAL